MKRIYLRNVRRYAVIDDQDYESMSKLPWYGYSSAKDREDKIYVRANVNYPGKVVTFHLHREVMNAQPGESVTFKNRNPLDCRRDNLIRGTRHQIRGSSKPEKGHDFKGVHQNEYGTFSAQITVSGKRHELGVYGSAEAAALAYDRMARELLGADFAYLNFPEVDDYSHVDESKRRRGIRRRSGAGSKYLGVSRTAFASCWYARITDRGRREYLGCFKSEIEAARAFDVRAKELRGEAAILNFPEGN